MAVSAPVMDNFYTPANQGYYEQRAFANLDRRQTRQGFRLFEIDPRQIFNSGIVSGKLIEPLELAEFKGRYSTISYFAGDPNNTLPVYIDGAKFNAFANMWKTLMEACWFWSSEQAHGDLKHLVWIDQICINQSDSRERSHQVGLMRPIYEHANECIVAFPGCKGQAHSLRWLKLLLNELEVTETADVVRMLQSASSDGEFRMDWFGVYDMLSHHWWRRAWVQQEFSLSNTVHFVQCESHTSLHHLELLEATKKFKSLAEGVISVRTYEALESRSEQLLSSTRNEFGKEHINGRNHITWALEMMTAKTTAQKLIQQDLKCILLSSHQYKSTDPRDRIYSLIGLTPTDYSIIPDYGSDIDLAHVMIQVTTKIMELDQQLDILLFSAALKGPRERALPSWVPDWTCGVQNKRTVVMLIHSISDFKYSRIWEFAKGSGSLVTTIVSESQKELTVQGFPCHLPEYHLRILEATGLEPKEGIEVWYILGCRIPLLLKRHQGDSRTVYSLISLGNNMARWFDIVGRPVYTRFWNKEKPPTQQDQMFQEVTLI